MNDQIVPWPTVEFSPRIINLFWSHVQKTDYCWIWMGWYDHKSRGSFVPGSRRKGVPKWQTHRFSWFITFGVIPEGLGVLHKCDNPICCRPDHLFLGTQKDNMQDASRKNRIRKGEASPSAKLTSVQVLEIRARYGAGGVTQKALASEYGIEKMEICRIINRARWAHI